MERMAVDVDVLTEMTKGVLPREVGATGLQYSHGAVYEDHVPKLQNLDSRVRIYSEMMTDPVINAILFVIEMYVRRVEWPIVPAEGAKGKSDAAFLEDCRKGMSHTWQDFLSEALSMLPYGFALHEIVYKLENGRVMWKKLPIRAQSSVEKWVFDKNGGVRGFVQRVENDTLNRYVTIPMEKLLLFRTSVNRGNPEGKSVLRGAHKPWFFKKKLEIIEAIGLERELAGYPVMTVPGDVFADNETAKARLQRAIDIVTNIRKDEQMGAVIPTGWELELLSSSGTKSNNTDGVIQRYDTRIAQSVAADIILMGHQNVGSYALAESKTALLTQAMSAWLDAIQEVLNKYAIPRLFALNGVTNRELPKFSHGPVVAIEPLKLANILFRLAGIDAVRPDDDSETHLRSMLGLPAADPTTARGEHALSNREGRMDTETRPASTDGNYTQEEV